MDTKKDLSAFDIYVVGAGAIGRVITGMLHMRGLNPTLVAREDTIEPLRKSEGFDFITNQILTTRVLPRTLAYSELSTYEPSKPSIVFYATKASYLPQAMEQARPFINGQTHHVFLQGGIPWWFGHVLHTTPNLATVTDPNSTIKKIVGGLQNVNVGMIKFGASLEHGKSELRGSGDFTFGSVLKSFENSEFCSALKDMFTFETPLVKPDTTDLNLAQTVWTKAAGSFAMSAYAMITGRTLGGLYECMGIRRNMIQTAQAIIETGNHIGIHENNAINWDKYFEGIAKSKPDHMMSITIDPSEIKQIIEWPMQIRNSLGLDMSLLNGVYNEIPEVFKTSAAQNKRRAYSQTLSPS